MSSPHTHGGTDAPECTTCTAPTTGTALDTSEQEWWTDDGERSAVVDYDHSGVAKVTREVLRDLMTRAGFTQAQPPPGTTAARHDHGGLMNTTGGIETVLARHRLYGDSDYGDDIVCGCESTPPTDALEADRGEVRWHETHVADAIAAHLLSDAVELRAARAVLDARRHRWDTEPHQGECITDARAALAAAVGGDTE